MNEDLDISQVIQQGIAAVHAEEFLLAFTLLSEVYSRLGEGTQVDKRLAEGLSYYGLTMALVQKKYKPAIDACRRAIELQFYSGRHYVNLARVYLAAGKRKKAIDALEEGLKVVPGDAALAKMRAELGHRNRPPVPFLSRSNPINIAIGRARHAKKMKNQESK